MKSVRVLTQPLPYGFKVYQVGDLIDMPDAHAKMLWRVRRVEIVTDTAPAQPKKRRVYRRRDIGPKETIVFSAPTAPVEVADVEK